MSRLLPATVTEKADLSGAPPASRDSSKVRVSVAPSTEADESSGGSVSCGVAVTSAEGSLLASPLRAMTRTAYSSPSVNPVITREVPFTLALDTSSESSQSAADSFHWTV